MYLTFYTWISLHTTHTLMVLPELCLVSTEILSNTYTHCVCLYTTSESLFDLRMFCIEQGFFFVEDGFLEQQGPYVGQHRLCRVFYSNFV